MNNVKKIIVISLIGLVIIACGIYLKIFGYVDYTIASIKCGQRAIILTSDNHYVRPNEDRGFMMWADGYACTEHQAIKNHYKPMFNFDGSFNHN